LRVGLAERADGKWANFETAVWVGRQNGKGGVFEALILAKMFLFDDELAIYTAHEFKTANDTFRRVSSLVENTPHLFSRLDGRYGIVKNPSEKGFNLEGGRRMRFIARTSGGSGRGFSADTVIFDEAFKLGAEMIAALLPTLSARRNPQVWYGSSAALATSEQMHLLNERARTPDPGRLAVLDWGCEPGVDVHDRDSWYASNPALGIRIDEEIVEAELRAMGEASFRRERLGVHDANTGESVFTAAQWNRCQDINSKAEGRLVFAVDVPFDRSAAAIAVAASVDGGIFVEVIDHREGTSWVVPRLRELSKRWRPGALLLDPGSGAGSLLRDLQDLRIEPRLINTRELGQATGAFFDAVVAGRVRHLGQPELDAAALSATRRPLGEAWTWSRKGVDVSPLVACTLAHWGVSTRKRAVGVTNLAAALEAAQT